MTRDGEGEGERRGGERRGREREELRRGEVDETAETGCTYTYYRRVCTIVPCTHNHLKKHVQCDDSLPQGLTEVVDGVINGVLSIQVEDPVSVPQQMVGGSEF